MRGDLFPGEEEDVGAGEERQVRARDEGCGAGNHAGNLI